MKFKNPIWNFLLNLYLFGALLYFISCAEEVIDQPFPADKNPWQSIRKERIKKLLPDAMKYTNVNAWIVICRENNNDPLAMHVGGENASGTAAFLFFLDRDSIKSVAISPEGEAKALKEVKLHDNVIVIKRKDSIWEVIASQIEKADPYVIAINSSEYSIADGLSHTQRNFLETALKQKYLKRLVSSKALIWEWLSVKLPEEIEIMKKAAEITAQLQIEAYKTIVPGQTKDSDVAKYLKKRMEELGVTDAWSPDQNPNVNSGPDRGHSHSTDKVIQPGDVIQTDFGIKVFDIWCSDIQRFAYVLDVNEKTPPKEIKKFLKNAIQGHRKVLSAMKPGVTGWDVDEAQRNWMAVTGSLPVIWGTGHPVGYWAHDAGPSLSGAARQKNPYGNNALKLKAGQTFAYDGFFKWKRKDGTTKTISVEEMAVITEGGSEYLTAPQDEWILISSE